MKLIYKNFSLHGIMKLICEFIRLILQSIKLIYQSTISPAPVRTVLARFCCHQSVKAGILREFIGKRHKGTSVFNQAAPCVRIGDIAHLLV